MWGKNLTRPALFAEVGMVVRRFENPMGVATGTVTHTDEDFSYRVIGPRGQGTPPGLDTAVAAVFRIGTGSRTGFYTAIDLEIGGVTDASAEAEMTSSGLRGTPELERTSVVVLGALAVVGVRGRSGNLDLAAEVAGGGHAITYNYHSKYHACETTTSVAATRGTVEARARAAWWFSPFGQLGVSLGKSLIDEGWVTGVFVGGHSHAWGGTR
jgi:hypothetical protein